VVAWQVPRPRAVESRFEALHASSLSPLVGRDEDQPLPPPQPTIAEILDAYVAARLPVVENKSTMLYIARTLKRLALRP
jgi:hypothetical protein